MALTWLSLGAATICFLLGGWQLFVAGGSRAQLAGTLEAESPRGRHTERLLAMLEEWFSRTRAGRRVRQKLLAAGIELSAMRFLLQCAAGLLALLVLMSVLGSSLLALIITVLAGGGVKQWLDYRTDKRQEQFVAQLPDLARLLSNAAGAGLSLNTGIGMAAREIAEPARSELQRVAGALAVGVPLEVAMADMARRLPSREVSMLVTTLAVQQRAGGRIITALQNMAATLDARKETRREVRTLMAGAISGTVVVTLLGLGSVVVLNLVNPRIVDDMLGSPVGRIALLVSGVLYVIGFVAVRRMTKVEI